MMKMMVVMTEQDPDKLNLGSNLKGRESAITTTTTIPYLLLSP